MPPRLTRQTVDVLELFLESPAEWKYGYDLSRRTGLKSGTLYPILMRLADHELLEACWEPGDTGKPPRHMYRLTPAGLRYARVSTRDHLRARAQRAVGPATLDPATS